MISKSAQGMFTSSTSVSQQELWRVETNRQQQTTQTVPPQQQELLLQPRQLLDQPVHQPHQPPRRTRETYKSCDFCAKRKRKCSGGLPRCSLCIEKKQPYCHYQLKPAAKTRMTKQAASRRGSSSSATFSCPDSHGSSSAGKRLVDVPEVTSNSSDLGVVTAAGVRSTAMVPGSMSLKRCRLSPSTATGLVGMQENIFLGDFFGCLGFLPLATESHIREAMVEMLRVASTSGRQQLKRQHNQGRNGDAMMGAQQLGGELRRPATESEGESWGSSLTYPAAAKSPATCMMWCAIALGSLVKGAPIENVSQYVRLARASLSECFDGTTVDNVRAFVMMSFLHGVMNDMEKNDRYLTFARTITSKIKEDIPEELASMLLTIDKMGIFRSPFVRKAGAHAFIDVGSTVQLPRVENLVKQEDVCNLFLISDRRLKQVFFEDMVAQRAISDADEADGGRRDPDLFEEPLRKERGSVGTADGTAHQRPGEGPRDLRPQPVRSSQDTTVPNGWGTASEPPLTASATRSYVEEAIPQMERLSKMLLRSDTFSGVGGLMFHGNLAYMKAVAGEPWDAFKSVEACVDIYVRYPGIVRFRSHLVHCALAMCQNNDRRDVYEVLRRVYNLVRPAGWKFVMPFEEWTSMRDICDHMFCRSVQVQMDYHIRLARDEGVVATPSPSSSPDSTRSWSEQHFPPEERPGNGAQQATSVSPPPILQGSSPHLQSTPHCSMNPNPGGAGGAATSVTTCGKRNVRRHMPQHEPLATDPCVPVFVTTAASAAVGVGDPMVSRSTIAATGQEPVAESAPVVPTGHSALELGLPEGELGAWDGEVRLTDEDLLDAASVFLDEEGLQEHDTFP